MKVKVSDGGGYQQSVYELDALPHVGELLDLGKWQGTVAQVTHIPEKFRTDGTSARIELTDVHKVG
jgi:hypothetical protein